MESKENDLHFFCLSLPSVFVCEINNSSGQAIPPELMIGFSFVTLHQAFVATITAFSVITFLEKTRVYHQ